MSQKSEEGAKKLVSVSATSMSVTRTRKKAIEIARAVSKDGEESEDEYLDNFAQVSCIRYFTTFENNSALVSSPFDSDSEVNAISTTFT